MQLSASTGKWQTGYSETKKLSQNKEKPVTHFQKQTFFITRRAIQTLKIKIFRNRKVTYQVSKFCLSRVGFAN